MDVSSSGNRLDAEWTEVGTNVYGILRDGGDVSAVAGCFVRAGWSSRSSSWQGYECETTWCRVGIDPGEVSSILLNGVVDPERIDELAGLLARFGLWYSLELYDEGDMLVREIQA